MTLKQNLICAWISVKIMGSIVVLCALAATLVTLNVAALAINLGFFMSWDIPIMVAYVPFMVMVIDVIIYEPVRDNWPHFINWLCQDFA